MELPSEGMEQPDQSKAERPQQSDEGPYQHVAPTCVDQTPSNQIDDDIELIQFSCGECHKSFNALDTDRYAEHLANKKCSQCEGVFSCEGQLLAHSALCTKEIALSQMNTETGAQYNTGLHASLSAQDRVCDRIATHAPLPTHEDPAGAALRNLSALTNQVPVHFASPNHLSSNVSSNANFNDGAQAHYITRPHTLSQSTPSPSNQNMNNVPQQERMYQKRAKSHTSYTPYPQPMAPTAPASSVNAEYLQHNNNLQYRHSNPVPNNFPPQNFIVRVSANHCHCKVCGGYFINEDYSKHLAYNKCEECNRMFPCFGELVKHKSQVVFCKSCANKFHTIEDAKAHTENCVCPVCKYSFKCKTELKMHYDKYCSQVKVCEHCRQNIGNLELLVQHQSDAICGCGSRFPCKALLNYHLLRYRCYDTVTCRYCSSSMGKCFLSNHYCTVECNHCKSLLQCKNQLLQHVCAQSRIPPSPGTTSISNQNPDHFMPLASVTQEVQGGPPTPALSDPSSTPAPLILPNPIQPVATETPPADTSSSAEQLFICPLCKDNFSDYTELGMHVQYEHTKPLSTEVDVKTVKDEELDKKFDVEVLDILFKKENVLTPDVKVEVIDEREGAEEVWESVHFEIDN